MIIDYKNGDIINSQDVYLHDDIFKNMTYDHSKNEICIELETEVLNFDREKQRKYCILFCNVIGIEATFCEFWGKSPHVFDFEFIDIKNEKLLPKLTNKASVESEKNSRHIDYSKLGSKTNFIETLFTMTSGDHIRIVCEKIILNK